MEIPASRRLLIYSMLAAYGIVSHTCSAALPGRPFLFEENVGQWPDARISYLGRAPGSTWLFSKRGISVTLAGSSDAPCNVRIEWSGATAAAVGGAPTGGHSYYWDGYSRKARQYASVRYAASVGGVVLEVALRNNNPELLLHAPSLASLAGEELIIRGANVRIDAGDVLVTCANARMRLASPIAVQSREGRVVKARGEYTLRRGGRVGLLIPRGVAKLSPEQPIIIDPIVETTLWGGAGEDYLTAVSADSSGHAYLVGRTTSLLAASGVRPGNTDGFVMKIHVATNTVVFARYVGGPWDDSVTAVAASETGFYIVGVTQGAFPITSGTISKRGPQVFLMRITADGASVAFATYLGQGIANGVAVDSQGSAWVVGSTTSDEFLSSSVSGSVFHGGQDAFVLKVTSAGQLSAGRYFGSPGVDAALAVAVGGNDEIWVTGYAAEGLATVGNQLQSTFGGGESDVLVLRLDSGAMPLAASYYGGSGADRGYAVIAGPSGSFYLGGHTQSQDFRTTETAVNRSLAPGAGAGFVTRIVAGQVSYSTYLGGSSCLVSTLLADLECDTVTGLLSTDGGLVVVGLAGSGLPTVSGSQAPQGQGDGFVAILDNDGRTVRYTTFLGGTGGDVALGIARQSNTQFVVIGMSGSPTSFPTTRPAQGARRDGFWAKIVLCSASFGTDGSFFPPQGGTYLLPVTAPNCSWFATTDSAAWITLAAASATGDGQLSVTVMPNTGPYRLGHVFLGAEQYAVRQLNGSCVNLDYIESWFPATGGSFSLGVRASCAWSATSNVPWVVVTAGSGASDGAVTFTLSPNTEGQSRTGQIAVGAAFLTLRQAY